MKRHFQVYVGLMAVAGFLASFFSLVLSSKSVDIVASVVDAQGDPRLRLAVYAVLALAAVLLFFPLTLFVGWLIDRSYRDTRSRVLNGVLDDCILLHRNLDLVAAELAREVAFPSYSMDDLGKVVSFACEAVHCASTGDNARGVRGFAQRPYSLLKALRRHADEEIRKPMLGPVTPPSGTAVPGVSAGTPVSPRSIVAGVQWGIGCSRMILVHLADEVLDHPSCVPRRARTTRPGEDT